jgi:hypothetical protein
MIDYNKELVSALKTILPTHHELTLHSGLKTPCISYQEMNNYATDEGDTIGYGRVSFQIKVWGTDIALLMKYAKKIDETVRPLGFTRVASGELYDRASAMIQKIMTYEANTIETFN